MPLISVQILEDLDEEQLSFWNFINFLSFEMWYIGVMKASVMVVTLWDLPFNEDNKNVIQLDQDSMSPSEIQRVVRESKKVLKGVN